MSLSKTVALVTGGASGLGAAAVTSLIQRGARVVVADLPHQQEKFVAEASITGSRLVVFTETDVTKEDQVKRSLDTVEQTFGEPVNALINCAGIAMGRKTLSRDKTSGDVLSHSLEDFSRILSVNTVGSFNVSRLAAERMALGTPQEANSSNGTSELVPERGCIINTASVAAYEGQIGQVAYAASKGGIVGMTVPMARDLSQFGIRVVTIAPGLFRTPLIDGLPQAVQEKLGNQIPFPNRLGQPREFGELVSHIIENPYLNGEVIRLDGGLRMPP